MPGDRADGAADDADGAVADGDLDAGRFKCLRPPRIAVAIARRDLKLPVAVVRDHRRPVVDAIVAPTAWRAVAHLIALAEADGVRRAVRNGGRKAIVAGLEDEPVAGVVGRGQPALKHAFGRGGLVARVEQNVEAEA